MSALRNAAVDFNIPVAIFSLEMASVQLVNRMISAEAELEGEKIKKGNLADYEWQQLVHKTNKLSSAPIYKDDTPALSILELRAKCRRLKAEHGVVFVVRRCTVDYLAPAHLDDRLTVITQPQRLGGATFELAQEIRREAALLVTLQVRLALLSAALRPARLPPALNAALRPLLAAAGPPA